MINLAAMHKLFITLFLLFVIGTKPSALPDSKRASDVRNVIWPGLQKELNDKSFDKNYRVYLRIIKQNELFEIWLKKGPRYELFKRYNICYYSGGLGTKTRSGDNKSPEGFYSITPKQLNPVSNYHLAVNIGYPNKLETLKGYTGNAIMIHGSCASIGCYAMTNPGIEEIYTLIYKAFESGQTEISLAIFPFRMDKDHLKEATTSPYYNLWKNMQPGYEIFEKNHVPPVVGVDQQRYTFAK
jgi:murein L,D-transpeptidase YafK